MTGIGAILGLPVQFFGLFKLLTGMLRAYRGALQLTDATRTPYVTKSPFRYAADLVMGVGPFDHSISSRLGGWF